MACERSPRRRREHGVTQIELLVSITLLSIAAGAVITPIVRVSGAMRTRLAAHEIAGTFRLARGYAARRSANVAVKFITTTEDETVRYALFRDGDGDGVRTVDIESGADPRVSLSRPLAHFGSSVRFGFPDGDPPRDPSGRRLDRLEDPIRFGRSDMASFSSIGASSPGTVYLTDGQTLFAVRISNRTGRVRILRYYSEEEQWIQQ